ncbi:UDP-N-acetylglucosamine pyrophosphorylase [Heterostelium album PN500]|uniref:UDP-N-acetylglucosamine diphosphorylase n=1 Tax=Heterostelium pallidum (strain ATCC 26659 / Pp 5 / PN500) TaxID=670386 RepID=D3B1Q0_HETP5|nr:UDP-N-acetylglucosamine pyrophosphorylase [Heterostelium album PN500]EFA85224.1 UDP-N-acetylglucosamine pyrophosphorylase [Heterostelium album PN500]|eukprot:XP_020437333.1 UDP-N-acetylglucosamine pyrophosphorylase [Heterostelium album PN500]
MLNSEKNIIENGNFKNLVQNNLKKVDVHWQQQGLEMQDNKVVDRKHWEEAGQGHVFNWYDELSSEDRLIFEEDLRQIDVDEINTIYKRLIDEKVNQKINLSYHGFENVKTIDSLTTEDRDRWETIGHKLISEGRVALLLLAGGQATRLGTTFPKGQYDIGLPSKKSLFQLQAERVLKLEQMTKSKMGVTEMKPIQWYIMTSKATHDATIEFFEKHNYFGLLKDSFFFFQQTMIPCLTPEGKIINETSSKISLSPNGNGGLYHSLLVSGGLSDMRSKGIEYISQYCVDNVLIKMADPLFLGYMHDQQADCAAKVVAKVDPEEPVGVMALRDGKPCVLEYSEIDRDSKYLRDEATGRLTFNYAHICINNFSFEFLDRIASSELSRELPYHVATKKIPYANEQGIRTTPDAVNGWKMEMFIFDVFPYSKHMVCLEVKRDEEFSPLKNNAGMAIPKDSPETCLRDICQLHRTYIERAGGKLDFSESNIIEISPLISYSGESLETIVSEKLILLPKEIK